MPGNGLFFEKSNDELICQLEGRGFGGREGKLVSPVRRDWAVTSTNNRNEKEGGETRRKTERNPPS